MLGELGFQLSDPHVEGRDLLVEQEVFGLELGAQAMHEGPHGWGRRCPIER